MKKMIALLLCTIILVSLCACGSNAKKLTADAIRSALNEAGGTLDIKGKDDNVKSFTLTMEDVSADHLPDSDFLNRAIIQVSTNASGANTYQLKAALTFPPVIAIYYLLEDDGAQTSIMDLINLEVSIVSNGESYECNGWTLSATVDQTNDRLVFEVKK